MKVDDNAKAVLAGYEALKDIINAAAGGSPYTTDELTTEYFTLPLQKLREAYIGMTGVTPPGEE